MAEKARIVLGVGDRLGQDTIVGNHICAELCEYNSSKITRIVKNKLGSWHVSDYDYKVMLPEIRHCPHCGKKLTRKK